MPKLSVIIPVYNQEKFLDSCLDSVLGQDLNDIEVIAVNDGSTDRSWEILEKRALRDIRLQIINQENQGAGASRNKALVVAKGDFVCFMDADDWYPTTDTLSSIYENAIANKVKICGGSFCSWRAGTPFTNFSGMNSGYRFSDDKVMTYAEYQFDYGYHRFIYSRQLLLENNIYFPDYRRFQDPPFFVRAMICAGNFFAMARVTYCYREGEGFNNVNWDERKSSDLLRGLTDNLKMSRAHCLPKLHWLTYQRLTQKIYTDIFLSCASNPNGILISLLVEANASIDTAILQNYDSSIPKEIVIPALRQLACRPALKPSSQSDPRVSVIVLVYNTEQYLEDCLNSLIRQTLQDIEIICVDDGSTDHSPAIIQQYLQIDKRISVVEKSNGGVSSARNAGVRAASGQYIYFIDSDDMLEPDALEQLYSIASGEQLDILYFDAMPFFETAEMEKKKAIFKTYYQRTGTYEKVLSGTALLSTLSKNSDFRPSACLQLIRHEFYLYNGLSFYEGVIHEDNIFTPMAMALATRAKHVNLPFYLRRVHENSIMTRQEDVRNLRGYLLAYCENLLFFSHRTLSPNQRDWISNIFDIFCKAVVRVWNGINEEERSAFLRQLNLYQKIQMDNILRQASFSKKTKMSSEAPTQSLQRETMLKEMAQIKKDNKKLLKKIDNIRKSKSYRIGRFITYFPRKLRGLWRGCKAHGVTNNMKRDAVRGKNDVGIKK